MDLKEVHKVRRVANALKRIQSVVMAHSTVKLNNVGDVMYDLELAERQLALKAIQNSDPAEILKNAGRLANLNRRR